MSITAIIIVITVIISYFSFKDHSLQYKLTMNPVQVSENGQWYRLITSGFIHSNWIHLGFNMFTLYFFGESVEYIFYALKGEDGIFYYLGFYLSSIVISDLPSLFKYRGMPNYNSLGASGGVASMVFCSILFFPIRDICLYGFICIPGFILGGVYIVYSYMKGKNMSDHINHNAHLIGAIYGLVFSIIVDPTVLSSFISEIASWRPFS